MADLLTKARRSWNMSRIRAKDSEPELRVRSALHLAGYRFRLHSKLLPGTPDLVLPKLRTVVFVNGCFWHRHAKCRLSYLPKTRQDFWNNKFRENVARDRRVRNQLRKLGWRVVTIWECEATSPKRWLRRIPKRRHSH